VGEHQRFAFGEVRGDVGFVEIALDVIGYQDHHHVGGFGGFGGRQTVQAGGFGLGAALAVRGQADDYVEAGIAQVQRVRVALAAVADDGDFLAFEGVDVSVFFVKASWHLGELFLVILE
jgi:hypothetical protein